MFHHKPEPLRAPPFYVEEFGIKFHNRHSALKEEEEGNVNTTTVNGINNNIVKPLVATAKEFATPRKRAKKFSRETLNLMEKRKNLQPPTSAREKVEAAELSKTIEKKQLQDLRKHRTKTIQDEIKRKGFKIAGNKTQQRKASIYRSSSG